METTNDNSIPSPAYLRASLSPSLWEAIKRAGASGGLRAARLVWAQDRPPHADGRPAGTRGLDDILTREPFKCEWEAIENEFISKFETVAHEAALQKDVTERFHPQTGALIERREDSRNRNWMVVQVLRRYDEKWREQKRVSLDGQIQHSHQLTSPDTYAISGAEVMQLGEADQNLLFSLLEKIESIRATNRAGLESTNEHETKLIESQQLPHCPTDLEETNGPGDGG